VNGFKFELFIHVAAVIVGLGATFALPVMQGYAERSGVAATRFMLHFSHRLENFITIPGAIILFIFGGLMIGSDQRTYKDDMPAWLIIAIIWFLAAFAVAFFLQRKQVSDGLKTLEGVPDNGALPDAYLAISKRMQIVGGLLGLSIIGIAFLMVWKPGQ
jgi:uncharacterized membrane protein